MALIGGLYAGNAVIPNAGAGRWIVIASIYFFCIVQVITWSISIKVWAAEIQPQHTRAYFLFGGCTAIATVVSFFYMAETKGKSLAEIERKYSDCEP